MHLPLPPRPALRAPLTFVFSALAALVLLGFSPRQATAAIYYVSTTGSNFNTGLSWSSPQSDLQATIHAAQAGDQVWVKTGTYTGPFTTVDGVALYGGFAGTETSISQRNIAAHPTILNGSTSSSAAVVTVDSASVMTVTIDGFTIQNGLGCGISDSSGDTLVVANCTISNNGVSDSNSGVSTSGTATFTNDTFSGNGTNGGSYGGGVSATGAATFTSCAFSGNNAYYGGGVYTTDTAAFTNCTFSGNAAYYGGGAYNEGTATLAGCTFSSDNASSSGGGVYSDNDLTMSSCSLTGNTASNSDGGGVFVGNGGLATLTNCTFSINSALYGGGVYTDYGSALTLSQDTLTGNAPDAVDLENAGASGSPVLIKDDLIVGMGSAATDADGIDLDVTEAYSLPTTYATIANNTISDVNAGIYINSSGGEVDVANNIFYASYGALNDVGILGPTLVSSHNAFYGNVDFDYLGVLYGAGDETANPMFANAAAGNYHLASGSPLINAGDDSYVVSGDTDRDGHARIQGAHVDIGAYEAPSGLTITSFTPTSGVGGTSVTITGTGFTGATAVAFNGVAATSFKVVSSTEITVTVPATAATGPISVTTSAGTAYSAAFFKISPPTITSFTPTSGPVGTVITITGTNLNGVTAIRFHNASATVFSVNPGGTQIMVTVPASTLTGTITVTTPGGSVATTASFTVTAPPAPSIASFAGMSGTPGTAVTVTGANFMGATMVMFNDMPAAFKVLSLTQVVATVPAGATTGAIKIVTSTGTATSASPFTVLLPPDPISFSPVSGPAGTVVTITGTNLGGATAVRFHNANATVFSVNQAGTQITVTVPQGALPGTLRVTTSVGSAQTPGAFTPAP